MPPQGLPGALRQQGSRSEPWKLLQVVTTLIEQQPHTFTLTTRLSLVEPIELNGQPLHGRLTTAKYINKSEDRGKIS